MSESKEKPKEKEKCDCLFCNSKCPECGSEAISVTFKPQYKYGNDEEDHIDIFRIEDIIEVECADCGGTFEQDMHRVDDRLNSLIQSLYQALALPKHMSFTHKHGGNIESENYRIVSTPFNGNRKGGD